MHGPFLFIFIIPLLLVGAAVVVFAKLVGHLFSRSGREEQAEEARMIQEMYQSLSRLDERVEVLETLLLEQDAKER